MIKKLEEIYLLIYMLITLFFLETLLRVATTGGLFSLGIMFSIIFSVSFAVIIYALCCSLEEKAAYYTSVIFLSLTSFIFSSQLIYYKTFRMFYSLYSLGNSLQVLDFWRDIVSIIGKNLLWIAIMFLPLILFLGFGKKYIIFRKSIIRLRYWLVLSIIFSHFFALILVNSFGNDENSPYDIYYKNNYPLLSVQRLGLLTTIRLDFKRLIFRGTPTLEASSYNLYYTNTSSLNSIDSISDDSDIIKIRTEYNVLDIDFHSLLSEENKENIRDIHSYFSRVQPTAKNSFTGKYKDYNLILVTAESFSPYAVNKDLTPTLYKLVNEGYSFSNFYTPLWGVSTSDGEYVALTGLIPKSGVWSFYISGNKYMPFVMGNQLKELGYHTVAYHNHSYDYYRRDVSHPNMGYEYKGIGNGLKINTPWPASDLEMMEATVDEFINNQPFHAYYMTVSGHMQYNFSGNAMAVKNKNLVEDLSYSQAAKAYLATQIELDRALEYLLNRLEEAGIADKTLIALSSDHYPYGLDYKEIDELAGHQVERNFELYKNTFILYTKGMRPITIDKPSSSLDIIPTLSNLLGLEYDSRLLMGRDIFSNHEPLVIFINKSFITDKGYYNGVTREFYPNEGVEVDDEYISMISSIVNSRIHYSARILETDYYRRVLK